MIFIYKRPNCAYCPMVIRYLSHIGVPYRVKEAEGDMYINLSQKFGYSVPLVYNDKTDQGMVGYDIARLKKLAEFAD